jgi:phosphonate metabolism protein (transferase hexapeptide repeat family)
MLLGQASPRSMETRVYQDPATVPKRLGPEPFIHPTAQVRDSRFGAYCEVGARTRIAETSFGDYSYVVSDADIIYSEIGRFCSIAAQTRINPGNHPLDRVALNHFTYRSSAYGLGEDDAGFFDRRRGHRVTLGHDVWIGHGAIVLPGVSIGHGAAVGAGAVVSKDLPPFAVAVGVPARVLRFRFAPEIVAALLRIAWWDWDRGRLADGLQDFRHLGAEAFCRKYDPA